MDTQQHRPAGMKAKTIKAILAKKINSWIDSIEDPALARLLQRDTIVTGGSIASMLLGEHVNDYDVYFRTKETTLAVANYYTSRFQIKKKSGIECAISVQDDNGRIRIVIKSAGIASENGTTKAYEYFEGQADETKAAGYVAEVMQDPSAIEDRYEETEQAALSVGADTDKKLGEKETYCPVFLSTNAITLSGKLQLILRFYGDPDEIHKNYDYVHCTSAWTSSDGNLTLRADAMESLLSRELRYVGSKYPICSLIRMRKFIMRGWTINAGQIVKMVMQISQLDLTSVEVLRDQLTGVDVAYFMEVINAVAAKDPLKVNSTYLIEIIDRMF